MQNLLEQALPAEIENTALLEAALAVEQDQELADEMAEWDCTIDDGFAYFKRVERERSSAARFGGSILIRRAALKSPSTVQQSS